ncbi:hypothetical protein CLAFUW4_10748 [Fulvia fulva]|uniref:Uncharacterized protein n=1 Tax=Passalora fulva TaxID=5499 RepID=A0A9Q8LGB7_PASFU|nr:uncharacterized protein CLAFUR5_05361 [Fulvia fulva]KAK4615432.1 hypothetical protein CLAFUR4_10753 [Fulvia fulva]KAK4617099.1 hypothetical protein CLAFUR0_10760 [Fulvia fulva]UJO16878.1 hypothetical protein CLAFUR5_05361 [Fulvia fulva]WPV19770.1 hypothetical protein CLAFUW4_10748 [Fulvia fulva]WPV34262.1 hypothetical protein CLAFUW7_10750 [Fulvia fulva]
MRAFSYLVSIAAIASARVITISEYPSYCRVSSSSISLNTADPSASSSSGVDVATSSESSPAETFTESSAAAHSPGATGALLPLPAAGYQSPPPPQLGVVVPAADTVSQLFCMNYAEAIREAAGIEIGDNNASFVGTQAQEGPLAGSYIPDSYTYAGLYQIANNLLNTSTMFYTPDYSHGYVQALSKYLDVNFPRWLSDGNAPALRSATDAVTQTANKVIEVQNVIYGAKSVPWAADKVRVATAFE